MTRRIRTIVVEWPLAQLGLIAALFLFGATTIDGYGTKSSILSMLVIASFLGIAAAGQTIAVLVGGIDLSVPFVIGAANVATAELTGGRGWPLPIACAFIGMLALLVGAMSGYLSHRFDVHPLIITLGIGSIVAGSALVWTEAKLTGAAPSYLSTFVSPAVETWFIPLPPVVVFWIVLALLLSIVLARTTLGRRLYATGASPPAARLALVSTTRVWVAVFATSALLSATTGVLLAGFSGTGLFNIGDPYLFTSIASVVIGGTSLLGARGDYVRTVLGALILVQTTTILVGNGYDAPTQQVILGILILVFVATYGREVHVRNRI